MRILIALTYYRPHYSGLTIYTERLAKALAKRGHQVTVLTSQYEKEFPREEIVDGVNVIRLPVAFRVSKGVIMPTMPLRAFREIRKADVVNLHVPQLDAAPISVLARLLGKPVVLTYQCDLQLPPGFVHRIANFANDLANTVSSIFSNIIVTTSQDYADESKFLGRYMKKIYPIQPPVDLSKIDARDVKAFREKYELKPDQKIIGMVARLAAEKGAEYLVRAVPKVLEKYPNARVLYAGQHQNVMGEEAYAKMLAPLIAELGDHWRFLGLIPDDELAALFKVCDVTVLPSVNSTEAYGIVQVESMTSGTPAVASNIPGVRMPIQETGMGEIFPVRDSDGMAQALLKVLSDPKKYQGDLTGIAKYYAPDTVAQEYEKIFGNLISSHDRDATIEMPR